MCQKKKTVLDEAESIQGSQSKGEELQQQKHSCFVL